MKISALKILAGSRQRIEYTAAFSVLINSKIAHNLICHVGAMGFFDKLDYNNCGSYVMNTVGALKSLSENSV
jgi:hypothetical protein